MYESGEGSSPLKEESPQPVMRGWRHVAVCTSGELLGTTLLVAGVCLGCLPGWPGGEPPLLLQFLNVGLTVMIVIQIFGHISGAHVNPAVTVASMLLGGTPLHLGLLYCVAQCVGGVLGYGILLGLTPDVAFSNSTSVCVTMPNPSLSDAQAVGLEALMTFVLVLIACSVWDSRNQRNTDSVALKFGFAVAAINFGTGSSTGASMNPARSLGPTFWTGHWERHWVYWVGPLSGAVIAALMYRNLFASKCHLPGASRRDDIK